MRVQGRRVPLGTWAVFSVALVAGCTAVTTPGTVAKSSPVPNVVTQPAVPHPPPPTLTPPAAVPEAPATTAIAAPNTYVYVVNGIDPFSWAGLDRLADRLRSGGYPNTRYGRWYEVRKFEREIRSVHAQDPSAQVVLIGFSAGSYPVRAAANRLTREGVPVAMVGYIGGDYLRDTASSRPAGASVVNVRGNGYLLTGRNLLFNGADLSGAENVSLRGTRHFDLPKQERTFDSLYNGIAAATGGSATGTVVAARPTTPTEPPVAAEPPGTRPVIIGLTTGR